MRPIVTKRVKGCLVLFCFVLTIWCASSIQGGGFLDFSGRMLECCSTETAFYITLCCVENSYGFSVSILEPYTIFTGPSAKLQNHRVVPDRHLVICCHSNTSLCRLEREATPTKERACAGAWGYTVSGIFTLWSYRRQVFWHHYSSLVVCRQTYTTQ
jgi:hypothetical protein